MTQYVGGLITCSICCLDWVDCSILWREQLKADKIQFNFQLLKVFVTAIFLHTLWETLQSSRRLTLIEFLNLEFLSLLAAVTNLNRFIRQLKK